MTRKRIFFLFLGFLALLTAVSWIVLQETGTARTFVEKVIARIVRGPFRIGTTEVDLTGGTVTVRDLAIGGESGDERRISSIDRIEVGMAADLSVRQVTVSGLFLDIDLVDERATNFWDLLQLDETLGERPSGGGAPPAVLVRDTRVRVRVAPDAPPLEFGEVALDLLPVEDEEHLVALEGTMRTNLGVPLRVHGQGDLQSSQFRALVEAVEPFTIDRERIGALHPDVQRVLARTELAGDVGRLAVWLQYPAPGGNLRVGGGAVAEIADLSFRIEGLPRPVTGASARVAVDHRDGGTVRLQVERKAVDGDVELTGTVRQCTGEPGYEARLDARNLLLTDELLDAAEQIRPVPRLRRALDPRGGRIDLDLHLTHDPARGTSFEDPRVTLDLAAHGLAARFTGFRDDDTGRRIGFPVGLASVDGRVRLRDDVLTVEDVTATLAEDAGGGEVNVRGHIAGHAEGEPTRIHLDITSQEMTFCPEVRRALNELLATEDEPEAGFRIYDRFSPRGRSAVSVRLRPDGGDTRWRVDLRPILAGAVYDDFPYPVRDLTGLVRIDEGGTAIELDGRAGEAVAHLDGRFLDAEDPEESLRLEMALDIEGMVVDTTLAEALAHFSPALRTPWDVLAPRGTVDGSLTLWQDAGASDIRYDLRLDVRDGRAELSTFPLPIGELRGSVFVHGVGESTSVEINTLEGTFRHPDGSPPAGVLLLGTMAMADGEVGQQDVTAVVRDLQLCPPLAEALHVGGMLDQEVWDILAPSGVVDSVFHRTQTAASEPVGHRLSIDLRRVRSDAEILPGPASGIVGEVVVEDGEVRFGELRGEMLGTPVHSLGGEVVPVEGGTRVSITVTADGPRGLPVDDRMANLFTGPFREAWLERQVRGNVRVHRLELVFTFPEDGDEFRTEVAGEFTAAGISLDLGTRIEGVTGGWQIGEAVFDGDEGRVEGTIRDVDFRIVGHPVEEFTGRYEITPEVMLLEDLSAVFHGGTVQGTSQEEPALRYELPEPGRLSFDLTCDGVALTDLLRASGVEDTQLSGLVTGRVVLDELAGTDFVGMEGRGDLEIAGGRLGAVPIFAAMYSYLAEDRLQPAFESARVRFRLADRTAHFDELTVTSPVLGASGSGAITLDGYVDMTLRIEDLLGSGGEWLIVPEIVDLIAHNAVRFHVYGYLRSITARPRFLGQSSPGRQGIPPIPPRRHDK